MYLSSICPFNIGSSLQPFNLLHNILQIYFILTKTHYKIPTLESDENILKSKLFLTKIELKIRKVGF